MMDAELMSQAHLVFCNNIIDMKSAAILWFQDELPRNFIGSSENPERKIYRQKFLRSGDFFSSDRSKKSCFTQRLYPYFCFC